MKKTALGTSEDSGGYETVPDEEDLESSCGNTPLGTPEHSDDNKNPLNSDIEKDNLADTYSPFLAETNVTRCCGKED